MTNRIEPVLEVSLLSVFPPASVIMSFDMLLVVDAVSTNSCQSGDLVLE